MFSKARRKYLWGLSCLFIFGSVSCNLPLGEKPPAPLVPDTGFEKQTECLNRVVPGFENFVDGTAKEAEVIATWNCVSDVVTIFEGSVTSSYEDRFTARALANFIEQNFLKGKKITDATLVEVFRIKQLLVGGSIDSISREEMRRFVSVIHQIRDITVRLNPYMKVYSFHWKVANESILDTDVRYFETANLELQQAVKDLAALIELNGQTYCIDNFINLLKELSQFGSTPWTWLKGFEDAMPLVHKLKRTLTGGDEANILPTEWRRFGLLSGRGFVQYLRYYYFLKDADTLNNGSAVAYFTRSIDDLFSYLGDMVEGKPGQALTRLEVLDILKALSKFFPNVKISDGFLIQVMKIKVLLFGGKMDRFEKADFELAQGKLTAFRELAEHFLNYASVYALSWKQDEPTPAQSLKYFQDAETNLKDIGNLLGQNLETSYDLKDLIQLAKEFDLLYPRVEDSESYGTMAEHYVPILIAAKNIIFSDRDSVVGKSLATENLKKRKDVRSQWSDFLSLGAKTYSRYEYYYYFLRDKQMLQGVGLDHLARWSRDGFELLDTLILRKPQKLIAFEEFSRLWGALKGSELLPKNMTVTTLDRLTTVILGRWLVEPRRRLAGETYNGLGSDGMNQMRSEFGLWLKAQQFLSKIYANVPAENGKMGARILSDLTAEGSATRPELQELKLIYDVPVPLAFDKRGRLHLGAPELPYLQKTSNLINGVRAGVRLVLRSYAMDEKRIETLTGGISKEEAMNLFTDVRSLMIELDLLDPRNAKFMENRFRDASLFTPWSNGDGLLDFKEGNDLILMILSGIEIDNRLYELAEKSCRVTKPTVYKDDWTMDLACVDKVYQRELPDKFSSMPSMKLFLSSLSPEAYQEVFLNLLKTAGHVPVPEGTVKVGDLALFPQITQYVETVFQKYDANHDGVFDSGEAMAAFPTFRAIILEAANGQVTSEKQVRGLFSWLLKYAKKPESISEKLKFLAWCNKDESEWDISADRQRLAKILGFIADSTNKGGPNNH